MVKGEMRGVDAAKDSKTKARCRNRSSERQLQHGRLASRRSVEDTQKGRENEPAVAWLLTKPDAGFLYAEHRTYNNEYSMRGGK